MEKAVLKTLEYYNQNNFPLKAYEIHKWLIGKKASLPDVEKALIRLSRKKKTIKKGNYYFLSSRKGLVKKRLAQERKERRKLRLVKAVAFLSRVVPWVKFMGWDKNRLVVITKKNRLYLSKLNLGIIQKIFEQNIPATYFEEDKLILKKDVNLAHQILGLKVLINRENIYPKLLEENPWLFKILPNWTTQVGSVKRQKPGKLGNESFYLNSLVDGMEYLVRAVNLRLNRVNSI